MNRIVITHIPWITVIQVSWYIAQTFKLKWFKVFLEATACKRGALPLTIVACTANLKTLAIMEDIRDYLNDKGCEIQPYAHSPIGNIGWIKTNYLIFGKILLYADYPVVRKSVWNRAHSRDKHGILRTKRIKDIELLLIRSIPDLPPLD